MTLTVLAPSHLQPLFCHSERREESLLIRNGVESVGIPRYARNDKRDPNLVLFGHRACQVHSGEQYKNVSLKQ